MKRAKKFWVVLAKLGIGIGLLAWLSEKVDWLVVWERLRDLSPVFIVLYIAFQLTGNLISAKKWQMIARHKYAHSPFTVKEGFLAYLTGAFINNFLPSTLGGDAYRGLWLAQRTDAKAAALSTVVFDRFIGLWTIAILAVVCSLPLWSNFFTDMAFRVTFSGLIVFLLGDLFITYAYFQPWFHRWLEWLPFRARRLIREVIGFTRKGVWAAGSLYSVLFALVGVALSNWMLFRALGSVVSLPVFLSVIFLVTIVSSIPLSINNIGVKEWAYITFFPLVGVSVEIAVTAALLSRFIQMLISSGALPWYVATRPVVVPRTEGAMR